MSAATNRRYAVAAGMVVLAVALGAVFGVVVARAIGGYDITAVGDGTTADITVGDRAVAVWASPSDATTYCSSSDARTGRDSFSQHLSSSMTVTIGSRSWKRVGVVEGDPGSVHRLTCSDEDGATIGYADNPRVLRYVVLGGALGGTALLLVISAFVLALVTALRQRSAKA